MKTSRAKEVSGQTEHEHSTFNVEWKIGAPGGQRSYTLDDYGEGGKFFRKTDRGNENLKSGQRRISF
ncbi:MAG: hypothetical protein HY298_10985 [Verrucomicrobia bacterium]|nr:hypothetical protein [Verrucomicrobiota bacterium]